MKRAYEKPDIIFEDFSLSTSIALNCEVLANSNSGTCPYVETDGRGNTLNVFTETVTGCVYKPANGDYNGLCYHNPYDANNLFNS